MPEMQALFNQGKLAVLCNNGPLVEPFTRTTYQNGTGKKPLQLFSHSDQVGLFQTAIANIVSQTGWGGRLADKTHGLNGSATFPNNISIAGINLFLSGVDTRQLASPIRIRRWRTFCNSHVRHIERTGFTARFF